MPLLLTSFLIEKKVIFFVLFLRNNMPLPVVECSTIILYDHQN